MASAIELEKPVGVFDNNSNSIDQSPVVDGGSVDVEGTLEMAAESDAPPNASKDIPWASIHNGNDTSVISSVDEMKDSCLFLFPDWKTRLTRFWILLILAAIIATAGVIGNATATVIGAMIVAPLMVPIQGLMVSSVLQNRNNWFFSLFMVLAGIGVVVLIGFLFGLIVAESIILPENNDQVKSRINPTLTDLIAALATGMVAAISLVRKDIAGALPGVAISISLVPPLAVVGLMLSINLKKDAGGAMLLFTTNFLCIMVMGIITMYMYGVHKLGQVKSAAYATTVFLVVVVGLVLVAVPLYFTSQQLANEADAQLCLEDFVNNGLKRDGWQARIVVAKTSGNRLEATVAIVGPPPFPDLDTLDGSLVSEACPMVDVVEVGFFPARFIEL